MFNNWYENRVLKYERKESIQQKFESNKSQTTQFDSVVVKQKYMMEYLMLLSKKYLGSILDRNAIAQIDARLCLDLWGLAAYCFNLHNIDSILIVNMLYLFSRQWLTSIEMKQKILQTNLLHLLLKSKVFL